MAELKSCPLCDGKAKLIKVGDNRSLFVYQCSECGYIKAKNSEGCLTPWGAKKVWNRRVSEGRL